MAKESKPMMVLTLPLKTEKWQEDLLRKRFECCRKVYNAMLNYELKQYHKMLRDKEYIASKEIITQSYKIKDKKECAAFRSTEEYKAAQSTQAEKLKEYGMTEFSFITEAAQRAKVYQTNIGVETSALSIAKPMWSAFHDLIFGKGNDVHFKKYGDWNSVASSGKSYIRLLDENGNTVRGFFTGNKLSVSYGMRGGKIAVIPIVLDTKDEYAHEVLNHALKVNRIVRKCIRGKDKYYIQITAEGTPPAKYDQNNQERNPLGKGKVGLYVNTLGVTVYKAKTKEIQYIPFDYESLEEERKKIKTFMNVSKKETNPWNFQEDGTIIPREYKKNGKPKRLKWEYSNNYKRAQQRLKELHRLEAEKRKLAQRILVNQLVSLGNDFYINDYDFASAAKKKVQDEFDENGAIKRKKKGGKNIQENAPSAFVNFLQEKVKSKGGTFTKIELDPKSIDYSKDDYKEKLAKDMIKKKKGKESRKKRN